VSRRDGVAAKLSLHDGLDRAAHEDDPQHGEPDLRAERRRRDELARTDDRRGQYHPGADPAKRQSQRRRWRFDGVRRQHVRIADVYGGWIGSREREHVADDTTCQGERVGFVQEAAGLAIYSRPMLTRTALAGFLFLMTIGHAATAQERPNFSGTWTAAADGTGTAVRGKPLPPAWGQQFTIDHQGQVLTLARTFAAGPATIRYVLDGSETASRMPGRLCEPDSGATWTAAWDGDALTLAMTGALPPHGKPIKMDVRSTLRLESPEILRVEVTSRVAGQTAPRTSSTTYKRTTSPSSPPVPAAVNTAATIAQVSWISGVWVGSSGTTAFEERWTPAAGGSMMAISRTLGDGMMSAFEFLCIVERGGGLVYQAMPNGRSPATDFTLTKIDADTAIFENPAHDFPKMIRYTKRPDGSLEAVVSGESGQRAQTFVFRREK
jgi:hypothetical protein